MYYDNIKNPKWIRKDNPAYFNKDLRYTLTSETEQLLKKVSEKTAIRREYERMAEAFSCILANLFHAYWLDAPLIYSRNANAYNIERKRYGYDFYTYKMIVRLVDAMFELGFVQGVKGRKTACGSCLSSKLWATSELIAMFQSMGGLVFIKRHDEVLYLKDGVKRLINYRESVQTRRMRKHLKEFNEMLSSLDIIFTFRPADLSNNALSRSNKMDKLVSLAINNQINLTLRKQNQDEDNHNGNPNPPNQHNTYHHDNYISDIEYHYPNTDNSNNKNKVIMGVNQHCWS